MNSPSQFAASALAIFLDVIGGRAPPAEIFSIVDSVDLLEFARREPNGTPQMALFPTTSLKDLPAAVAAEGTFNARLRVDLIALRHTYPDRAPSAITWTRSIQVECRRPEQQTARWAKKGERMVTQMEPPAGEGWFGTYSGRFVGCAGDDLEHLRDLFACATEAWNATAPIIYAQELSQSVLRSLRDLAYGTVLPRCWAPNPYGAREALELQWRPNIQATLHGEAGRVLLILNPTFELSRYYKQTGAAHNHRLVVNVRAAFDEEAGREPTIGSAAALAALAAAPRGRGKAGPRAGTTPTLPALPATPKAKAPRKRATPEAATPADAAAATARAAFQSPVAKGPAATPAAPPAPKKKRTRARPAAAVEGSQAPASPGLPPASLPAEQEMDFDFPPLPPSTLALALSETSSSETETDTDDEH